MRRGSVRGARKSAAQPAPRPQRQQAARQRHSRSGPAKRPGGQGPAAGRRSCTAKCVAPPSAARDEDDRASRPVCRNRRTLQLGERLSRARRPPAPAWAGGLHPPADCPRRRRNGRGCAVGEEVPKPIPRPEARAGIRGRTAAGDPAEQHHAHIAGPQVSFQRRRPIPKQKHEPTTATRARAPTTRAPPSPGAPRWPRLVLGRPDDPTSPRAVRRPALRVGAAERDLRRSAVARRGACRVWPERDTGEDQSHCVPDREGSSQKHCLKKAMERLSLPQTSDPVTSASAAPPRAAMNALRWAQFGTQSPTWRSLCTAPDDAPQSRGELRSHLCLRGASAIVFFSDQQLPTAWVGTQPGPRGTTSGSHSIEWRKGG